MYDEYIAKILLLLLYSFGLGGNGSLPQNFIRSTIVQI